MKKITLTLIALFSINAFSSNLSKGTVVTLADGIEVSIEELKEGDLLLTLDAENNNIQISKVEKIEQSSKSKMKKITLADGLELTLSCDHPLLSSKGWASADKKETKKRESYKNKKIGQYKVDSFIYSTSREMNIEILPIISIEEVSETNDTYTLKLDNKNAAFIANGIFVGQQ